MYTELLTQSGLNKNEALIYELLLKSGELKAGQIAEKSPLKRGLVYKTLLSLEEIGLITKNEPKNQVAKFNAKHPSKLRDIVNNKEKEVNLAKNSIDQLLPQLSSEFSLSAGKPGVRFYEGLDGFKKALDDSLTATETIYTYVDLNKIVGESAKINQEYVKKREKKGIKKRLLLKEKVGAKEAIGQNTEFTSSVLLPESVKPFKTSLQIYDGKVAYYTLREKNMISVIIEDKDIYEMHKSMFEFIWEMLENKKTEEKPSEISSKKPKNQYDMSNLDEYSTARKD